MHEHDGNGDICEAKCVIVECGKVQAVDSSKDFSISLWKVVARWSSVRVASKMHTDLLI